MPKKADIEIPNPELVVCTVNSNKPKTTIYDCLITRRGTRARHDIKNIRSVEFDNVPYTSNPPVIDWTKLENDNGDPSITVKLSDYARCRVSGNSEDGTWWKGLICFVPEDRIKK